MFNPLISLLILLTSVSLNEAKPDGKGYAQDDFIRTKAQGRIFKGNFITPNSLPYHVGLTCNPALKNIHCGGALITPRYVLTAAHCIRCSPTYVTIGAHNFLQQEPLRQVKASKNIIKHPNYQRLQLNANMTNEIYDFALIQLLNPAVLGHAAKLICLPSGNEKFGGKKITVSGWGIVDPVKKIGFSRLMSVDITGFSPANCSKIVSAFFKIDPKVHLCAGLWENRGPLSGDSGGPGAVTIKGKKVLAGIVSHVFYPPGVGTILARVSSAVSWIKQNSDAAQYDCWKKSP